VEVSDLLQEALTATIAFVVTNLDDLAVLMLLFLQAPQLWRETIAGQYLGFGILVLLSLPGFWLGQLPLKPWIGLLGLLPIGLGIRAWLNREAGEDELAAQPNRSRFAKFLSPQIGLVAALTIANGGDNIAIYTALFSGMKSATLTTTLLVWSLWVGLWCAIARSLAGRRRIQTLIAKYQHILVPIVLITLGIYIITTALI
jgi:cadmium resistance protein CadD (predicted permease)